MIERVRVQGYKSLKDIDVRLGPLTVILGPNAAGKTNLFDALALLARIATGKTIKDAFDPKIHRGLPLEAFYIGGSSKSGTSNGTAKFSIEVDVKLSPDVVKEVEAQILEMRKGLPGTNGAVVGQQGRVTRKVIEERLRYRITIEMLLESGYLRVRDEKLLALKQDGNPNNARNPFLEKVSNRLRLRMEGQARPTEHQIGLDYALVSAPLYPPHYPHITAFREELSRWRFYYLEPREMRLDVPLQEVKSLLPSGEGLAAFFNTLKVDDPKRFQTIQKTLHTLIPPIKKLEVERTSQGFLQLNVVEEGGIFTSRVISEGTLRILGLLAITNSMSPATVIGLEEPENGVHPQRLSLIARLMERAARSSKQILINTHSPLFAQELAMSGRIILCQRMVQKTEFMPYDLGPLFLPAAAEEALAQKERSTPFAERIVRGDFGG